MSYILDALKKAEQGRSQGKAPALFAVQTAEAPPSSPKPMLAWIIALVLIINGAAFFYWFGKSKIDEPAMKTAQSALPVSSPPSSVVPENNSPPPVYPTEPVPSIKRVLPPVNPPRAVSVAPPTPPKKRELETPVKISEPHKAGPIATTAATSTPPTEKQSLSPSTELPPDIQQAIPKLVVGMHMYSGRPSNRLVTINDKPLHEGDELSPGLKLVEVMPDGMIFSYKGFRFKKGIN